jgi:tetratricopeptide (TPR) repeat protein
VACLDEDTIVAFAEGRLSPGALAGAENHLAGCEVCRGLLAAAMRTVTVEQSMHAVVGAPGALIGAGAAEAPAGPMPPGTVVGRYTVLALAGRGGMGEVYAAYDPEMDRKVALKLLRASDGREDARGQARLLREGKAMARLSHPNVVSVHDAGTFGGRVFVAMEYVDGTTLRDWLAAEPRTQREILRVFGLAGRGLAAAHAVGLVHRDFKPQNVMLAADGSVRVMDFGLARAVGDAQESESEGEGALRRFDASAGLHLTRTGEILGTPRYMAPEQFKAERTDARTDQFSFCVALYEALYGAPPFADSGFDGLVSDVLAGRVRRPPPKSNVRGWLRRALLRGLATDPSARWPSMAELLAALAADPVEAGKRRLLVASVVALAAMAGLTVARGLGRSERLCQGGPARLEGAWTPAAAGPRRAAVQRAFLATGAPAVGEVWVRVAAVLDRYAGEWLASYRDACEATQVRREQSAAILDLRMTCLDQRRGALAALTDVLARADRGVVSKAVDAASALPAVSACADLATLQAAVEPLRDAAKRAKVDEIRAGLAKAKALTDTGKALEATDLARRLLEDARALAYPPLVAETLLRYAWARGNAGVTDDQLPAAEEAVWTAIAARQDQLAVEGAARLGWAIGYRHAQPKAGERWALLARSLVDRLGPGHELLRAWQLQDEASIDLHGNDPSKALDLMRESRMLREKILPPDHPEVAIALRNEAEALHQMGRDAEALKVSERVHGILVRAYGPASGEVAVSLSNRGEYLVDVGRAVEAEGVLSDAARIWEAQIGPTDPLLGYPLTALGRARLALGRAPEAVAPLERANRVREAGEPDKLLVAETWFALARALWDGGGDRGRARDLAARARQAYAQLGTHPKLLTAVEQWLATHPGARTRR